MSVWISLVICIFTLTSSASYGATVFHKIFEGSGIYYCGKSRADGGLSKPTTRAFVSVAGVEVSDLETLEIYETRIYPMLDRASRVDLMQLPFKTDFAVKTEGFFFVFKPKKGLTRLYDRDSDDVYYCNKRSELLSQVNY